ncbi:MAG: hypothetical protein IKB65_00545 [Ruminiclostridium sp.]|nr:hypothetical protein [Ruminiclostridium sp.]
MGETIVIDEMYPVSDHPASEIPFRMELTITEVYSPEESEANRHKKQFPVARFAVSVTGDYEGQLELDQFFYRPLLTAGMEKVWPLFFPADGTMREVKALEIGEEYELVLTVYQEDEETDMKSYPYLMISYYYPDSSTINDIYIDLTSGRSSKTEEEAPDLTAAEQAQYYEAAVEAEDRGYYAVAKNLYEDIPGYQDANVRLQSVLDVLSPYNGTYYGESHQHEGVSVWVYVEDGTVWTTYDVENTPVLEYELFQYETQADGTPVMAFATGLTRFFLDNQNASYTHGFTMTQNGDMWSVMATEGGSDRSWNSTLEKVSDTVDVEFD